MITTLILVLLIALFLIVDKLFPNDIRPIGTALAMLCIFYCIPHIGMTYTRQRDFDKFLIRRNAFEQTIIDIRANGNPHEMVAVVKDIAEWNISLAEYKYQNSLDFFGQYVDDRFEDLNPIK
jgi:hypothetical protein